MGCKDLKVKAIERFISIFSTNSDNNTYKRTIIINGMSLSNIVSLDLDNDYLYIKRYVFDNVKMVSGIRIADISNMVYINDLNQIISLDNIEF